MLIRYVYHYGIMSAQQSLDEVMSDIHTLVGGYRWEQCSHLASGIAVSSHFDKYDDGVKAGKTLSFVFYRIHVMTLERVVTDEFLKKVANDIQKGITDFQLALKKNNLSGMYNALNHIWFNTTKYVYESKEFSNRQSKKKDTSDMGGTDDSFS